MLQKAAFFSMTGVVIDWEETDNMSSNPIAVPDELYQCGCVKNIDEGLTAAKEIGFPVMIKASEGGGGKGIRKASNSEEFANLFRQVCMQDNRCCLNFLCET